VDFIVGDMEVAVEAKSSARISSDHLRGLRALVRDHTRVKRRIVVCREEKARKTDDEIEVWPVAQFVRELWSAGLG
jgi:predicted AAA+ superfamily ATPase